MLRQTLLRRNLLNNTHLPSPASTAPGAAVPPGSGSSSSSSSAGMDAGTGTIGGVGVGGGASTLSDAAAATFPLAKGPAAHDKVAKIGLYRECLLLANTIRDKATRDMSIREVRDKWREQKGHGGMTLELSLASTIDRISYLRMCTSKPAQRKIRAASVEYDWGVVNPMENQEKYQTRRREEMRDEPIEQSHGKGNREFVPKTNWGQNNIDPDMIKKHKELTDRQYFMGPHWRGKPKPLIYEDLSFEEQLQAHFAPPPIIPKRVKKKY